MSILRNVFTNVISRIIHSAEFRMTSSSLSQVVTVYGTLKFFFFGRHLLLFSFYTIFNFKFLPHFRSLPHALATSYSPSFFFPYSLSLSVSLVIFRESAFALLLLLLNFNPCTCMKLFFFLTSLFYSLFAAARLARIYLFPR